MSTHMKRALVVLALVVIAAGVAFLLKLGDDADAERAARAERRALLAVKIETRHRALRADDERLSRHLFFAPTGEGDAGPLLLKRLPWGPAAPGSVPALTDDEQEAFGGASNAWLQQESHAAVARVDLTWLKELAPFAYWNWDALDGPRQAVTFPDDDGPLPNVVQLIALAKVRLLQGLKSGDVASAALDVRHLARLLYTSEHFLGAVGTTALLRAERAAVDEAARRGLPVDGIADVFSNDDIDKTKDLILAATTAFTVDPVHPRHHETLSIGRCIGLNEALAIAIPMRTLLGDRYAARDAELDAHVERSGCRLPLVRRALAGSSTENQEFLNTAVCMTMFQGGLDKNAQVKKECGASSLLGLVPQVRTAAGESLLSFFDDVPFVRFLDGKRALPETGGSENGAEPAMRTPTKQQMGEVSP